MIENDTIDVSEWLHQSPHKAYPFAMERINAKVHHRSILCSTQFPFDELYHMPEEDPILNGSHLSAAEFFVTLRQVALFKNDYTRLRELLVDIQGGIIANDNQKVCPMTLFMLIMRPLQSSPQHRAMVERLCLQPLRTNDWGWINQCKQSIRESFDKLDEAIALALDIMKKKLETPDVKRDEVSLKFDPQA